MAFISEIHYQNFYAGNSGVTEYVEVALTAADFANAADFTIATYQVDGTVADSISLDQLTPVYHPLLDLYTYTFETPVTNPDHNPGGDTGSGEAEAVSLVNTNTGDVLAFYDIGGGTSDITATEGPAVGETSTTIAPSASGYSIQFDPFGHRIDHEMTVQDQPYATFEITGAQIGSYVSSSATGNGDDLVVTLDGTVALGTAGDTYTIIVSQTGGFDYFNNGQFVTVLDGNGNTVFENEGVNNDDFQGRGAGDSYLIFDNGFVIDMRGLPGFPSSVDYTLADDVTGAPYRAPYGELNFDDISDPVPIPCFVAGTLISTLFGGRRVEDLQIGDLVLTKDNGYQEILWTGVRKVTFADHSDRAELRPIRVAQNVAPSKPSLVVSPQHRILVSGPNVSLLCGEPEALVSAENLRKCGMAQRIHDGNSVCYYHFMCKRHELVLSNGTWTESLDPYFLFGPHCPDAMKRENLALFGNTLPLLVDKPVCVRPVLRAFEAYAMFVQSLALSKT